ncbi:trans-Golgi network-localized SYP41-interacting protein 1 [Lactuca sativa]|uniref:Uncharacterized protein n=1 Tax=Lactuca sativa TaxID=4236 RepID=A0A9R1X0H3_LACSA|nr:trans-Golgi network-localized SYP41-interacting protein 1 [Lactuca sativa]KAJ0193759.1 hypothetical protein LSAT_V11C800449450 [Lactuca sativa]
MEDDNDLEQVTGSPTAGENGFVHIESVDSAQMDGGSIDQVERLEQDDGVVVTGVDAVQDEPEPLNVRTTEDVGPDEFVDCPDDLVSNEARSPAVVNRPHQLPFRDDDTEVTQHTAPDIEREILPLPQDNEEENGVLIKEVSNLHHLLKALSKQKQLTDGTDVVEGGEKSLLSLHEMVKECSNFIEISLNEQSHAEATISELNATLHMKDKEIEDLMVRVNDHSISQDVVALKSDELSSVDSIVDRILYSFAPAFGDAGLSNTSVSEKLSHLERTTSFLLEKYYNFLSEIESFSHCLAEVKPDFHMQNGTETVFITVREELLELKRKELEVTNKNTHLEYQYGQFMEQIDKNRETIELLNTEVTKLKGEVEQEKTRYTNTKEKLSMAVTKGKALVQQRDSLKQSVSEKTSELERCLTELQEKSTALEAAEFRNNELMQTAFLANSLQEALTQRDMILQRCGEILLVSGAAAELQSSDIIEGITWLANERSRLASLSVEFERLTYAYNLAQDQSFKLQDENHATMEAARVQIDRLTASFLAESQGKYYLEQEYEDLTTKYEGLEQHIASTESSPMDNEVLEKIQNLLYVRDHESKLYEQILEEEKMHKFQFSEELRGSKDEKNTLQINLQRSEEKASLLREKLSMAVKKGKGLVQERENMKQQMAEKNTQIEGLTLDLQKQESTLSEYRNQINNLESDLLLLKEEKGQLEQFLYQSNSMLQNVLETIDGIILPVDLKEPVEKVKWLATYLSETQVSKAQTEQELEYIKDEAGVLTSKLTEALTTMKSLEDAVSVSERNFSQLAQEKNELDILKTNSEQEVQILNEEISTLNNKLVEVLTNLKSLEDTLSNSEKTITQLTKEKIHVEEELHKAIGEATSQTNRFQETSAHKNSLEEALSLAKNNIHVLMSEKEEAQASKVAVEMELQKVKEEASTHSINLDEAYKTIKSLEDAMSQLKTNVSQFSQENEKALDSRSVLESEIKKLREEAEYHKNTVSDLVGEKKKAEQDILTLKTELNTCNDKWGQELSRFLGNLQVLLKDESLFTLFKKSFEKKIESLKEIDYVLKDINCSFDSEQFQDHRSIEESWDAGFGNDWNIGMLEELNAEDSEGIIIGSDVGKTLDKLNARNQILADQFGSFSILIDDMIASLLKKLEVIKNTMPSLVKQTKELEGELEKARLMYDKAKEENDAYHGKVFKLETELEASGNMCKEISSKLVDYQTKEENWNERERELSAQSTSSIKDHEYEGVLSASEINMLFDKIDGIAIPFPFSNLVISESLDPVKKLFYIVDSVNELLEQITLLSHSKEDLVSKQTLEVEHLKGELSLGLQSIIQKFGGEEYSGVKKSAADVAGLVPVLERFVQGVVLDGENSRFKLMESQRVKEELTNRVKLLEDYIENRTGVQDKIQERGGIFQPPSLPAGSEISEIEDLSPVGKVGGLPLVPSAAQVRSLRKGSNDQLAITIDSESERLLSNKSESFEDKGHIFKSLNTSGLVPIQGKMIADRVDGIWVSGDRALMRRPRARLGLIVYWIVLHLWLLGTIL